MSTSRTECPDLPEYMTWDELERLPEEIADQIGLWDGRVVWRRRGPAEHQAFTRRITNALERCARENMSHLPGTAWRVESATDVFLSASRKSNFLTPDFLVYRHLSSPYEEVRAAATVLAGEVLSPSSTIGVDMETKKSRYATAGIPWYWEVRLARESSAIATVRAYALATGHGTLPEGVRALRSANYIVAGEWSAGDEEGIRFDFPFPINIPWSELDF